MSKIESPLVKKLSSYVKLSEIENIGLFEGARGVFSPNQEIIFEGQNNAPTYVLYSGWALSYKVLLDGTRQIVNIHIPGDFLGFRNTLFRNADLNVAAITQVKATILKASNILAAYDEEPRLAIALLWAASRDDAMLVERLVSMGRRTSEERMAHFFMELGARTRLIGSGDYDGFECPLTQYHLADILGMSDVHVNRVLRSLRQMGLMTFRKQRVLFDDFQRLCDFSGFDVDYMDHKKPSLAKMPVTDSRDIRVQPSTGNQHQTEPGSMVAMSARSECA